MASFIKYSWLQFKRAAASMKTFLITAVLLLVSMAFLVALIGGESKAADEKNSAPISIGIVRSEDDSFMDMGLHIVSGMESVSAVLDITDMSEAEAKKALEKGSIAAYLVIPDGFIESVMYGENKKITCVTAGDAGGLVPMILDTMMDAISQMLIESQNSIYGMQNILIESGAADTLSKDIDSLDMAYFRLISDRDRLFDVRTGNYRRGLSAAEYYFCSLSVLFMLLVALGSLKVFVKPNLSFERLIRRKGLGAAAQTSAEYMACLAVVILGTLPAILLFFELGKRGIFFGDISVLKNAAAFGKLALLMLPAFALTAAAHCLIFFCSGTAVDCVLAEILYLLVSSYSGGLFYPASFLPEAIRRFGSVLPTGQAFSYLQDITAGASLPLHAAKLLIYSAALIAAAAVVRRYRLNHE